jgi:ribosomal protein L37E
MPIDKDRIAKLLTERGATKPCHRCGRTNFVVIDGYATTPLQDNLDGGMVLGGPAVPVALVACSHCGAVTPHAVGVLGLLPPAK